MKKIISTGFYLCLLMLPLSGHAEPATATKIIEVAIININLNDSLNGYAIVKRCPNCDAIKLTINSTSQLTHQGKSVSISQLKHIKTNLGTVIYDSKTRHVNQIIW